MTHVRGRRSKLIHATENASTTLCGTRLKSFIVEPDAALTCEKCINATR